MPVQVHRISASNDWFWKPTATEIGGKAMSLYTMTRHGLPVPPAIVIPCAATFEYQKRGNDFLNEIAVEIQRGMAWIEKQLGRKCLFSVRSGAPVSMPGMMDTVLNVGLTHENAEEFEELLGKDAAADCALRLAHMYNNVVGPTENLLHKTPIEQIMGAVGAVFRSWNSERAIEYRKINKLSDEMGTAVIIQAMVYGNLNDQSGSGVLFTRNPSTGENKVTGEFLWNAQGEDVVAGTHTPENLASIKNGFKSKLMKLVKNLERKHRDMLDIEFTVEDGKLWVLQCRRGKRTPRAAVKIAADLLREGMIKLHEVKDYVTTKDVLSSAGTVIAHKGKAALVGKGLPAGGGIGAGRVVRSSAEAVQQAKKGPVVLVSAETTPEDIAGMHAAVAIVTEKGGTTSHAAVVSRAMGKACVTALPLATMICAGGWLVVNGDNGEVWADPDKTMKLVAGGDDAVEDLAAEIAKQKATLRIMLISNRRDLGVPTMVRAVDLALHPKEADQVIKKTGGDVVLDLGHPEAHHHQDDTELWGMLRHVVLDTAYTKVCDDLLSTAALDPTVTVIAPKEMELPAKVKTVRRAGTVEELFSGETVIMGEELERAIGSEEFMAKLTVTFGEPKLLGTPVTPYDLVLSVIA